ncbi:MFS general substrate transporter [Auricularia subglabra TFB-10046 SS5]|uniref:MFS general substrate transporter n=1 Tax=Auricularia subglabra (strain TFB-10046 / SS5) TaxID=717982 RepID=J0WSA8_AURST|nr:MFS general substrate transporter [Auricularia subglabra TFB-10046 SS5]
MAPISRSSEHDETRPLLEDVTENDRSLPKMQVALLCAARATEVIAFFTIFPYVNQMIADMGGVPPAEVGFWSGWIESMFSLTSMVVMLFWGRVSDNVGRKPVLTACLFGMAVTTAAFGLAGSVWQMIALRSLAGAFGGATVTVRTMLSENSTPRTQARAFSLFQFAANVGIFIGPLIGGALVTPTEQFPGLFGSIQLLRDYRYFLPGFVTGSLTAAVAFANLLWLNETLPDQTSDLRKQAPPSMKQIFASPGVIPVLVIFLYCFLLSFFITALFPVFYFTPIELGGFGLPPPQISFFVALIGVSQACWLLFAFPPLQRRFGTANVLRGCAIAWPLTYATMPVLNAVLRTGHTTAFWVAAPAASVLMGGVSMAYAGVQLALNDVSPSPLAFGTLNGIAQSLTSGERAFAPAFITAVYAYGVTRQILSGYLGWIVLIVLSCGFGLTPLWIPAKSDARRVSESYQRPD